MATERHVQEACETSLIQRRQAIVPNLDWLRQLNAVCDDFEESWRSGSAPSLESVLQQAEPERRSDLFRELLALELIYRRKRGETPGESEYIARFPNEACVVADVFAADARVQSGAGGEGDPADSPEMDRDTGGLGGRTDTHRKCSVLPVNTRIGNFELLEEISRGGMGVVFRARQLNLPREVALKMILSGEFADRQEIERFRAEAEAAAGLRHPNIVPLYEVGEEGGRHFFAMALIKGRDLHETLREGPLPARAGARLIQRIAEAVHYAHTRGIIHRDLKPGNILLDENGEPHVTDFGLARRSDAEGRLTETGQILGTVGFISPEQIRDRADRIGPATDIYALGAILYKCLTGRPPCQAADPIEALRQSVEDPPVSLRLLGPGIPRDLETVCLKCLEKEPARRYGSAQDLADDLGRHLRGEPIRARPASRIHRTWRWCRRRPALAGLLGGAVAGVVLVATILVVHNRNLERLNAQLIIKADEARSHQQTAERERQRATDSEQQARNMLAASSVRLAAEALKEQDYRTARELLDRVLPAPGRPDQRGFGWWYLHGQLDREHRDLLRLDSAVYFIGRSPDGKRIVAVGKDAVARLIDIESGTLIAEIPTGQIEVNGAAFSPDGRELATTGDDRSIQFHSLDTYQRRLCIEHAFPRQVFQPVYSPDGSQLICCGNDPVIRQFETRTGRLTAEFRGHTTTVQSLVLFSGGTRLASSSDDGQVKLWDTASQDPFASFAFGEPASAIELDPDRNLMIAASVDYTIRTLSIDPLRELSCRRHLDGVTALALNRDRDLVAAGDSSGGIRLWSVTGNGELAETPIAAWNAHAEGVSSLLWNVEGTRLISAGRDGRVVSWSLAGATDQRIRRFPVGTNGTNSFCLIPQTSRLITAGRVAQGLELYDWKSGTRERVLDTGDYIRVRGSRGGRLAAAIRRLEDPKSDELLVFPFASDWSRFPDDSHVARWSLEDVRPDSSFAGDEKSLAFLRSTGAAEGDRSIPSLGLLRLGGSAAPTLYPISEARHLESVPGTNHLVIITDRSLILWDVTEEEPIWSIDQPEDDCVQVSADGSLIATGGIHRVITVRNTADGSLRYQLNGHRAKILFLAFSPDNMTLASAGLDGVIKLWHVTTGEALFDLTEPGGEYRQVEFTADGQHLLGLHHTEQQDEIVIFRREDDVSTRHN